jgi:hypothetical protein
VLMALRAIHNFYKDLTNEKTVRQLAAGSDNTGAV